MNRSLQCIVSGKVQGVFYRAAVNDHAKELGVTGWIRNLDDGCVEILAQGSTEALDTFKARLFEGSPLCQVENIDFKWLEYDKECTEFQVRS